MLAIEPSESSLFLRIIPRDDGRNAAASERSQLRRSIRRRGSNSESSSPIEGQWHQNVGRILRPDEALYNEEGSHVEGRCKYPPTSSSTRIDLCYLFFLSNYECNSLFLSVLMLFDTTKVRIFDVASGHVILVSHHPGKNPYDKLDPLGLGNTDAQHAVHGGEWESATDVTSRHHSMPSFKIRPKSLSSHGRQFIKSMHGQ